MQFNLHIAIKAQNGTIFEELGNTGSTVLLPSLYDELAVKLQVQLHAASTKADPADPEPKITLVRQDTTFFDNLDQFAEALGFIEQPVKPVYA